MALVDSRTLLDLPLAQADPEVALQPGYDEALGERLREPVTALAGRHRLHPAEVTA